MATSPLSVARWAESLIDPNAGPNISDSDEPPSRTLNRSQPISNQPLCTWQPRAPPSNCIIGMMSMPPMTERKLDQVRTCFVHSVACTIGCLPSMKLYCVCLVADGGLAVEPHKSCGMMFSQNYGILRAC